MLNGFECLGPRTLAVPLESEFIGGIGTILYTMFLDYKPSLNKETKRWEWDVINGYSNYEEIKTSTWNDIVNGQQTRTNSIA